MKKLTLYLAAILVFAASCNNEGSKESVDADTAAAAEEAPAEETPATPDLSLAFPQLAQFIQTQDSAFTPSGFEEANFSRADTMAATVIDRQRLEPFLPYLVYNSDSSQAIDMVSYNYIISRNSNRPGLRAGGPDTEVAIIDMKKGQRRRLLYFGTMGAVLDVKWENDSTILIAVMKDSGEGIIPEICRYRTGTAEMETYVYKDTLKVQAGNYAEEKLNSKRPASF
ncbi:MAG TPA: hypothetical protein VFR58_10830 [Flavisolibacter sp.]|nr:hypothetical protein [Flavisolibacter sp.]